MKTAEAEIVYIPPKPFQRHGDGFVVKLPEGVEPFDFIQAGHEMGAWQETHPLVMVLGCLGCARWKTEPAAAEAWIIPRYANILEEENAVGVICEGIHLHYNDEFEPPCVAKFRESKKQEVAVRE